MGWKCAPQVMGLVRGEPRPSQKHRANIRKIAMEAGYERASRSDTLDRSRSKLNQYDGYKSGAAFSDDMENEAAAYRMKVEGRTKDKQPVVRERGLRQDAVIGWAVVYNPPADVCASWSDEDYQKFYRDCRECMAEIEPQLFRKENIRMSAEHYDEGIPPEENGGVIDRHLHDLGISKGVDGRYCGNLIDAKLMIRINEKFPALMRERGWDMDDLDRTNFELAKTDKEYASERNAKRRNSGLSVNKHLGRKARQMADEAAGVLDQAVVFQEQVQAEAVARQQQLDIQKEQQNKKDAEQAETDKRQRDTQRKQDSKDKNHRILMNFIYSVLHEFGDNRTHFRSYAEMMEALKAAKERFVDETTAEVKAKVQEEAAAEFQSKEDALEQQKVVLADAIRDASDEFNAYRQAKEAWQQATAEIAPPENIANWMQKQKVYTLRSDRLGINKTYEPHIIADLWRNHLKLREKDTRFFQNAEELSKVAEAEARKSGRKIPGE